MNFVPFLLQPARSSAVAETTPARDVLTHDDPLPGALVSDSSGLVIARTSIATFVQRETTDEN